MIDLRKGMRRRHRVRVDPGGHRRTAIADSRQARVDRCHGRRGDRHQARLVEIAMLEVAEDERALANQGAANAAAKLILVKRQLCSGQPVGRGHRIIAEEPIAVRVPGVGAAPRGHVEVPADGPAQFRLTARRDHLHLPDRVDAERNAAQRRRIVVGRKAIDHEVVGEIALARHGQADAQDRGGFGKELRAASNIGRGHARCDQSDVEKVAAVEGQALRFLLPDHGRYLAARGVDQSGVSRSP